MFLQFLELLMLYARPVVDIVQRRGDAGDAVHAGGGEIGPADRRRRRLVGFVVGVAERNARHVHVLDVGRRSFSSSRLARRSVRGATSLSIVAGFGAVRRTSRQTQTRGIGSSDITRTEKSLTRGGDAHDGLLGLPLGTLAVERVGGANCTFSRRCHFGGSVGSVSGRGNSFVDQRSQRVSQRRFRDGPTTPTSGAFDAKDTPIALGIVAATLERIDI